MAPSPRIVDVALPAECLELAVAYQEAIETASTRRDRLAALPRRSAAEGPSTRADEAGSLPASSFLRTLEPLRLAAARTPPEGRLSHSAVLPTSKSEGKSAARHETASMMAYPECLARRTAKGVERQSFGSKAGSNDNALLRRVEI